MHTLKTRILSAFCAAVLLLSLTACGGVPDRMQAAVRRMRAARPLRR